MATPWKSEEERNEYFEKLKLEDSVKTSLLKLAVKEFDNMICERHRCGFKKIFSELNIRRTESAEFCKGTYCGRKNIEKYGGIKK